MRCSEIFIPALLFALCIAGCRTNSHSSVKEAESDLTGEIPDIGFMDSSTLADLGEPKPFCQNRKPRECFSLVVMVPPNDAINDVGIATLNLMRTAKSETIRQKFLKNCRDGLDDYVRTMKTEGLKNGVPIGGIRKKFFAGVVEWRCYVHFSKSEVDPWPTIDKDQTALAVKMVKFGLESYETGVKAASASAEFKGARLTGIFSDVRIYSAAQAWVDGVSGGSAAEAKWRLVPQKGLIGNSGAIKDAPINWGYDKSRVFKVGFKESLDQLDSALKAAQNGTVPAAIVGSSVGVFINQAASALAGASSPVALLGVLSLGVHTVKDICKDDSCKKIDSTVDKTTGIEASLNQLNALSADDFILLENGLKILPDRILDGVFVDKADGRSLEGLLLPSQAKG